LILNYYICSERFYAVFKPFAVRNQSNKNKKIVSVIFLYCFIISLPFLYFPTLIEHAKPDLNEPLYFKLAVKCDIPNANIILTLLDSIVFCFCPFLISMLFSTLTLIHLIKRNQSTTNTSEFNKTDQSAIKKIISRTSFNSKLEKVSLYDLNRSQKRMSNLSITSMETNVQNNGLKKNRRFDSIFSSIDIHYNDLNSMVINNAKNSSAFRLTLMLMSFPISYLVCTLPIFLIISFKLIDYYLKLGNTKYDVPFYLAKCFMYINNSTNIFLFILFGKNLRKDFLNLFSFKKKPKK